MSREEVENDIGTLEALIEESYKDEGEGEQARRMYQRMLLKRRQQLDEYDQSSGASRA